MTDYQSFLQAKIERSAPTGFDVGVQYCKAKEAQLLVPTLFDMNGIG